MKKLFYLLFVLLNIFIFSSSTYAKNFYPVTVLTGGGTGALDKLSVADLNDGDAALYANITGTTVTFDVYVFDVDGTDAESSPTVIRPDDYSTGGVWRRQPTENLASDGFVVNSSGTPYARTLQPSADGLINSWTNADGTAGNPVPVISYSAGQKASTTQPGLVTEMATTAETTTGTDAARAVSPDGLAGSVYGQKEIGWTIHDSDASTAVADGKQAAVIPASMNGMELLDVTCSIADQNSATGGATTVVLRRVRAGTPQDMTSTGVTISYNEYTASDEIVDTSYDDVQTGDSIYVDINAVTTGAVHLGLSCTGIFQTP